MSLSDEEFHKLAEILIALSFVNDKLSRSEKSFIKDISERYEESGSDLRMSRRQWNWLLSIYGRYA